MNNIKKIFITIFTLLGIFGIILYFFKDISLINDDLSIISQDKDKYIKTKEIETITFDLNKYNISKEDYILVYDYFASLRKSGFNKINDNGVLTFVLNKTITKENKDKLIKKIEKILKEKKYKNIISVYIINYKDNILKNILEKNLNYSIKSNVGKEINILQIKDKDYKLEVLEKDLSKYFNDDTIKNLTKDKIFIQDKATPSSFAGFAGGLYPRESLSEMKYLGKEYQQGYDITDKSTPIIVLKKDKKNGSGVLIKNFNSMKYKESLKIYNNIQEFVRKKEKLNELTDDKGFSQQFQNIWNFTAYEPNKYFNLFFKGKGFKILEQDKNKLLLEGNDAYYIVFFDYNKEYQFDKSKFTPTGYKYYFQVSKTLYTEPIISKEILNGLNTMLKENNIEELQGKKYDKIGQILYYNKNNE